MKKAIIALLTTILAAFGYTAVDKTIEKRVSNLESSVSSQQEIIDSYRNESGSITNIVTNTTNIYDRTIPIQNEIYYSGGNKFLVILYSDGHSSIIAPNTVIPQTSTTSQATTKKQITTETSYIDDGISRPQTEPTRPNERTEQEESKEEIGRYLLYLDSVKCIFERREIDRTEKYYNDDFSVESRVCTVNNYYKFTISGHTDKKLAGKTITFKDYEIFGKIGSTEIDDNGNFKIEQTVESKTSSTYRNEMYIGIAIQTMT